MEQQDGILSQLQDELKTERSKMQEASKQIVQCKKIISDLQDEIDQLQKLQRDANNKVGQFSYVVHRNSKDIDRKSWLVQLRLPFMCSVCYYNI